MASGIGVTGVGHAPAAVVDAVTRQTQKFLHTCSLVTTYEPMVRLAELLNELTPGDFAKKTIFANSGAEAVENAVKLARKSTGRPAVICFEGGYHGRTLLTLSLTSKYGLFKSGFGPFAPEIVRLPMPQLYRTPAGMTEDQYVDFAHPPARSGDGRAGRPVGRRGDDHRAGAGRGRLPAGAAALPGAHPRAVHPARHRDDRRRGAVRHGPHRPGLRHRALRHRARPHRHREVARRRDADRRRHRPRDDHGRRASRRRRRHLRRQSGGLRRGAGRGRDDPPAGLPRPRPPARRGDARGDGRLAARVADRRRRARARADDAGRVRARPPRQDAARRRGHAADRQARRRQRRRADARRTVQQRRAPAAAADDARGHAARRRSTASAAAIRVVSERLAAAVGRDVRPRPPPTRRRARRGRRGRRPPRSSIRDGRHRRRR